MLYAFRQEWLPPLLLHHQILQLHCFVLNLLRFIGDSATKYVYTISSGNSPVHHSFSCHLLSIFFFLSFVSRAIDDTVSYSNIINFVLIELTTRLDCNIMLISTGSCNLVLRFTLNFKSRPTFQAKCVRHTMCYLLVLRTKVNLFSISCVLNVCHLLDKLIKSGVIPTYY